MHFEIWGYNDLCYDIRLFQHFCKKNSELKGKDINPLSKDIRVVSANEFLFTVLRSMFSLLM